MMAQAQRGPEHVVAQDIEMKVPRDGQFVVVLQDCACGVDAHHARVCMSGVKSCFLYEWNV